MKNLISLLLFLALFSSCSRLKENEIEADRSCRLFRADDLNYVIIDNRTYLISDEATYQALLQNSKHPYNNIILTVNKNKVSYAY